MFSRLFIERPRLAFVISIVMVLAGAISITKLPIAEYPEIAPKQIMVIASYVGASASVVSDTVAIPLESEFSGLENMLYFSSTCNNNGTYQCSLLFKNDADHDMCMVNVQNALKRAEMKLPEEVKKIGVQVQKRSSDILAVIAFKTDGSELSRLALNNYVSTQIRDDVLMVDGIAAAIVFASQEYAMRIWMDPERMSALGITSSEINAAVQSQNLQAAIGSVGSENSSPYTEFKLDVKGRLKTVAEFEEIVVRQGADGSTVKLRDIARIELGAKTYSGQGMYNGEEAVVMGIFRLSEANALNTVDAVRDVLKTCEKRFPKGVSYKVAYDPTEYIRVTLKEIIQTLLEALLLVVIITFLFLQDWRATLIPAIAIPVSLMGTFPFMLIFGYSINVLTMFGLILVIGSLVDDAIVVVENAQSLMQKEGLSPKDAALKSMQQITGAVIATTLVTVACYVPLAFYGGMVGAIYMQFAFTMCVSLCISTVNALSLSPALCAHFLRPPKEKPSVLFAPVNVVLNGSRAFYLFCVKMLLRKLLITALLFLVTLGGFWQMSKKIPASFLPEEDKAVVMCNLELAQGATLARTQAALEEFRLKIKDIPGVRDVLTVSGSSLINGDGENNGLAIVELDHWDKRVTPDTHSSAILQKIQDIGQTIPAAQIMCFTPPAIMGLGMTGGASFFLSTSGEVNMNDFSRTTQAFSGMLSQRNEVMYAVSSFTANTPQLEVTVDREKAETMGIPVGRIFSTLQDKLASFYINDFNLLGYTFYVKMQSDVHRRETADMINDIYVQNNNGDMVPITALINTRFTVAPRQIQRFNKSIAAEFNAQSKPGTTSGELMALIEQAKLPPACKIGWTNMSYQEKENQGQIVLMMLLACIFAYLFLVGQYESWTIPISIMLAVAFAIGGAIIGLALTHGSLSIYAQLGFVMLIGLAAKNAILMVEFAKVEHEGGTPIKEAAVHGAVLRYRAVMMTAWSFLIGVFPLVIASGAGAGSRQAIGITTFSGMLLATLVGVAFTPALYAIIQTVRDFFNRKRGVK